MQRACHASGTFMYSRLLAHHPTMHYNALCRWRARGWSLLALVAVRRVPARASRRSLARRLAVEPTVAVARAANTCTTRLRQRPVSRLPRCPRRARHPAPTPVAAAPGRPRRACPALPTSALATLPAEQAAAVRDARAALAAGDYARALALLEPLLAQLSGEQLAEVRLLYGQAQVGDRQFTRALATVAGAAVPAPPAPDLRLRRAAAQRPGPARPRALGRGRQRDARRRRRQPAVAAAVRLELEDMWLAANRPDEAAVDGQKGLDVAQARLAQDLPGREAGHRRGRAESDGRRDGRLSPAADGRGQQGLSRRAALQPGRRAPASSAAPTTPSTPCARPSRSSRARATRPTRSTCWKSWAACDPKIASTRA